MKLNDSEPLTNPQMLRQLALSDEFLSLLRQRVASQYYDKPHVIEVIARAILHSRGLYLSE
jgi:hypothetical protein